MQSAGSASENQLLFKVVPRNKAMSALQSLVGLTENVASRPGESLKHARAGRQIHPRSRWLGFTGLACIPLVGWLDYKTGPAISFALFYIPPVAMAAWSDDDRRSRLVFIVRGMDVEELRATLGALSFEGGRDART